MEVKTRAKVGFLLFLVSARIGETGSSDEIIAATVEH